MVFFFQLKLKFTNPHKYTISAAFTHANTINPLKPPVGLFISNTLEGGGGGL